MSLPASEQSNPWLCQYAEIKWHFHRGLTRALGLSINVLNARKLICTEQQAFISITIQGMRMKTKLCSCLQCSHMSKQICLHALIRANCESTQKLCSLEDVSKAKQSCAVTSLIHTNTPPIDSHQQTARARPWRSLERKRSCSHANHAICYTYALT